MPLSEPKRGKYKTSLPVVGREDFKRLQGRPCRPYAVANPFPRFTVEHEGFSPLNPFTDYLFVVPHAAHFRFITLFITRMDETNFSVEVNTSTFHTCEERPLCTIVATALTVSPS